MNDSGLYDDVFCIPYDGKYIIYLPLRGLILLGNDAFVNLLYEARRGNQDALKKLEVNESFISELFESEIQLKHLTRPQAIPPFAPTSVSLFLTNDCTLRCSYCYAEGGNTKTQMPWDMITGVLDVVLQNILEANKRRMVIHFHGGGDVSAAWPLLVQTREYLTQLTMPHGIEIVTTVGLNGILNAEQQHWLTQHIDSATISIDGTPDVQNRQRPFPGGKPSFPCVNKTLKALDAVDYPYSIRTTVTSESVMELVEIVSYFCEHYKSRKIKIEPMFPRGRAEKTGVRSPAATAFVEQFRKARKIAREANRQLLYSGARMEVITNVFCQAAGDSCAITPEGWITSCYEVLNPSDPLAEIFFYGRFNKELKTFEIDHERRAKLFNLSVLNKPFCAKCFCKWHCAGDCPVKAIHAERSGDPNLPDRCYINRELTLDQLIEALNLVPSLERRG